MIFKEITSRDDLERVFPVLASLRANLTLEDFLDLFSKAELEGYKPVSAEMNGECLGLLGYRFTTDFIRGRHLYVDDLVTSERNRSAGVGAKLLRHAEQLAEQSGVSTLRLCTGSENDRGKKFYEREGWSLRAVAYNKKI